MISRRALAAALAIATAFLIDGFFSHLHQCWVPLITAILLLTMPRVDIKQIIFGLIFVVIGLSAAWYIDSFKINPLLINGIIFAIFILLYLVENVFAKFFLIYFLPGILYLFWQQYWPAPSLYQLLQDTCFGGIISGLTILFVFPLRADKDFRFGLVPLYESYRVYLRTIFSYVLDQHAYVYIVNEKKRQVLINLNEEQSLFPEWVYQSNFNLFFRAGHRNFLLRTEQIGNVLFGLQHAAHSEIQANFLNEFKPLLTTCASEIDKLLQIIIARLKLQTDDFDVSQLELTLSEINKLLAKKNPASFDVIEEEEDYVHFATFVYMLNDLFSLLLKIGEALG